MNQRGRATHQDEPADVPSLHVQGPAAPRALCLVVDDFGLHHGVNQAAIELVGMGRVHAVSCMVGGLAWPSGVQALLALSPAHVDVGLHLDFTERPLMARSLHTLHGLMRRAYLRQLDPQAVRAEIKAQWDAFEDAMGRAPAFVDGHQHVHQLPVIRDALLAELHARGGAKYPWLRSTRRLKRGHSMGTFDAIKPWVVERLGARGLATLARQSGQAQNARLLGLYNFQGGVQRYQRLLSQWLAAADHADLLMCHPSVASVLQDSIGLARRAEFDVLSSPLLPGLLERHRLQLMPMRAILQGPGEPAQSSR